MIQVEESIKNKAWFTCDIPRKELKSLMKRDDKHARIHIGIWIILLIITGSLSVWLYPSYWSIPVWFVYGVLYSASNARWHECSHGTPLKTQWINELVFYITTAMEFRDVVMARWSHATHHSYTIIRGLDPEILLKRPPNLWIMCLNFFNIISGPKQIYKTVSHALGIPSASAKKYVPESEYSKMYWWARLALLPYVFVIIWIILTGSWVPVLLFLLPRFYGAPIQWGMILLQHSGLAEDVWDHRQNTRTVIMNPILGFLYMEMQYHVEHHMFPLVPYHKLKQLHNSIKSQLPEANSGIIDAYKEMIPALLTQRKDPSYYIQKL